MAGKRARVEDIHELALGMPHVTVIHGPSGNPVYQVGGKSFIFFRTPRPDAVDPDTGQRYPDVIVFWVGSEDEKQALIQDETTPFFTTPHFDGHLSVLLRAPASASCRASSWPNSCKTRGLHAHRRAVAQTGCGRTTCDRQGIVSDGRHRRTDRRSLAAEPHHVRTGPARRALRELLPAGEPSEPSAGFLDQVHDLQSGR